MFARCFTTMFVLLLCDEALAQSASAQAETLFEQARALMVEKRFAEACAALESSEKIDPTPTTQFGLAVCHELEVKLATSWGGFVDFQRKNRTADDPTTVDLVRNAGDRAARIQPRLSKLTISVPAASRLEHLELRHDSVVVEVGAWNRALPVDGGTHVIVAHSDGYKDWSTSVNIQLEGDAQTVEVPQLEPILVLEDDKPHRPHRANTPSLAFAGGSLLLAAGALGFEVWGRGLHSDAQNEYGSGDHDRGNELQSSANARRYISQGMGLAAVACAGVALVLYVRARSASRESVVRASRIRITPAVSSESAGLLVGGGW